MARLRRRYRPREPRRSSDRPAFGHRINDLFYQTPRHDRTTRIPYTVLTCQQCNSEFEGWHNAKYCSDECSQEAYETEQVCEECGEVFGAIKDRRYCSVECHAQAQRERVEKTCLECGGEFQVRPTNEDRQYCSWRCAGDALKDRIRIECETCGTEVELPKSREGARFCSDQCRADAQKAERLTLTCEHCEEPFVVVPSRSYRKYCCIECQGEAERDRIYKACKICGDEFYTTPCRSERECCSDECATEAQRVTPKDLAGYRHRAVVEGDDIRETIPQMMSQQSAECVYCGRDLEDTEYHVDHKTPLSRGGEHTHENTHLTCAECNHRKYTRTHSEFIKYRKQDDLYVHHLATENVPNIGPK